MRDIFDSKQRFILANAERAYEQEKERQKNMLEQSQRLLSLQTIVITAVSFAIKFEEKGEIGYFLKWLIFISILVVLLSLLFNLVAQWGFIYKGFPSPRNLSEEIDFKMKQKQTQFDSDVEYSALLSIWDQMVSSIRKNNHTRSLMLIFSMITMAISISLFAIVSFSLIV